jgi:putative membrane protein insertion efficiency factor
MTPLANALSLPVRLYRLVLSPLLGQHCRFAPTCSRYALDALAEHGAVKGTFLAVRRVGRCHPWNAGGHDPVPPARSTSEILDAPLCSASPLNLPHSRRRAGATS